MEELEKNENKCLIEFKRVIKQYGTGQAAMTALKGVDFCIKHGEFVAVMDRADQVNQPV